MAKARVKITVEFDVEVDRDAYAAEYGDSYTTMSEAIDYTRQIITQSAAGQFDQSGGWAEIKSAVILTEVAQ